MSDEPKIIKHKGEVYQHRDGGVIYGYTKAPIPEVEPYIGFRGAKIPHALWQRMMAFFIWTYEDTKKNSSSPDEALVHLFYNEDQDEWMAWAPPQRGVGMNVKTVDDHPNWKQAEAFVGFQKFGTGHHHCNAGAFQSGTDKMDEFAQGNGLHFTVGKLGENLLDLHARAVFNGAMFDVELSDWVDLADKYKRLELPEELHYAAAYYSLKSKPPEDTQFPKIWVDNYLKWSSHTTSGYNGGSGYVSKAPPHGKSHRDGYWCKTNGVEEWKDFTGYAHSGSYSGNGAGGGGGSSGGGIKLLTNVDKADAELTLMVRNQAMDIVDISLIAGEMHKLGKDERNKSKEMIALNEVLHKYGLNPIWLERWCEENSRFQQQLAWMGGA